MDLRKKDLKLVYISIMAFILLALFISSLPSYALGNEVTEKETNLPTVSDIVINEINSSPDDWVELMNIGTNEIDLSGYEIRDNSDDHRFKFDVGTSIAPGELVVIEAHTDGLIYDDQAKAYIPGQFQAAIGIGSGDAIRLYNPAGQLIDQYAWTAHASYEGDPAKASFGRYPDGRGEFVLMKETKGQANEWYQPQIVINEVESNQDVTDWVEIYNIGNIPVDISGWYLYDNDPIGHANDIIPVAEGTILEPGEFFVFDQHIHFTFGLGKNDEATIYNKSGVMIATYAWESHAEGVYARIPDGTGDFVDFPTSTKGSANILTNPVVINEIQSNDKNGGADWVELANPTNDTIDISGIVMKDNKDSNLYTFPEGTTIERNSFLVVTEDEFGFGLGKNDAVRLFENDRLIAQVSWTGHTNPTLGLYPNMYGNEYRDTMTETPGVANAFADIPEVIEWPGNGDVFVYDHESMFLEDSSGLDFHNGQLYAVDNGTGTFWILDVALDGTLSFANGFEKGKRVRLQKDANNPQAAGPDAEGITVDEQGFVYIASERDNSEKGVNFNTILKVNPKEEKADLVALQEWDLTASLPQVSANMGIEAVEWVANKDVEGLLYDENTQAPFDASNYPDAISDGVFFVALEDNGHVYAYVLHEDETFVQIADIDSKLGGAMALDYDTYENVLWVVADNGFQNRAATISLNGNKQSHITHVLPAHGVDTQANNEGFAIAEKEFTVNGQRPVYRFKDGDKTGSLSVGSLTTDYENNDTSVDNTFTLDDITWQLGSNEDLVIQLSASNTNLLHLTIDDQQIATDAFIADKNEQTIRLLETYLSTLESGEYLLNIVFSDKVFEGTLVILAENGVDEDVNHPGGEVTKPDPTEPGSPDDTVEQPSEDPKTDNSIDNTTPNEDNLNPDSSGGSKLPNTNTALYKYLLIGSLFLVFGVIAYSITRKKVSE